MNFKIIIDHLIMLSNKPRNFTGKIIVIIYTGLKITLILVITLYFMLIILLIIMPFLLIKLKNLFIPKNIKRY